MTDLGKAFTDIASTVNRLHGFGSNKMTVGYSVYADGSGYYRGADNVRLLEQLVEMGYLRKFIGAPVVSDKTRNWRYRFMIRNVCFGLTDKGWAVAPKYLSIHDRKAKDAEDALRAKNLYDRISKYDDSFTYDEALEMCRNGLA